MTFRRPSTPPAPSETNIRRAIIYALKLHPRVSWVHENNINTKGRSHYGLGDGSPDILFIFRGGRVGWIECKTPIGKLSTVQLEWRAEHRANGEFVECARSPQEAVDAVSSAK
jgi:hypothetical protein